MPTPRKGYFIDGERVPSVTQVLGIASFIPSDALCQWAAKLAREGKDWREERNRAGTVGSAIHDAIERLPAEPERPEDFTDGEWNRVVMATKAHAAWVARRKPKVVLQELQLVSRELRVGGTPDLLVRIGEDVYLTDHKSSKSVDAKAVAQVAAYARMVEEAFPHVSVSGAIIFHHPAPDTPLGRRYIRENGSYPFRAYPLSREVLTDGLDTFKAARRLYDLADVLRKAVSLDGESL